MRKINIKIPNAYEKKLKQKRWPKDTIVAGRRHTVGLKSDGTVTAVGDNKYGQCDVSGWCDIVAVAASNVHMATNTGMLIQSDLNRMARWLLWVEIMKVNAM